MLQCADADGSFIQFFFFKLRSERKKSREEPQRTHPHWRALTFTASVVQQQQQQARRHWRRQWLNGIVAWIIPPTERQREREREKTAQLFIVLRPRQERKRGEKSRKWCMMQHTQRVWFPVSRNWKFIVPCFCRRSAARVFCTDAMMRDATWNSQSLYPFDGSIAFRIVPLGREPNSHGVQQSSAVQPWYYNWPVLLLVIRFTLPGLST